MDKMNEIIKIEGLRKRFGDNEVLKGITTSVKQGEVVAIIGPSGPYRLVRLMPVSPVLPSPRSGRRTLDSPIPTPLFDRSSW